VRSCWYCKRTDDDWIELSAEEIRLEDGARVQWFKHTCKRKTIVQEAPAGVH